VGRSFIIKTQVTLLSGNDAEDYVVVEYGSHDDPALVYHRGYSATNVVIR
jgi:hypothetical protein